MLTLIPSARARVMPVPRDYAVELTATLSSAPPEIRLHWRGDGNATQYIISRKRPHENTWQEIGRAESSDRSFLDKGVENGVDYEYQVIKESWLGYTGYGYIHAGIMVPLVEDRAAVLLLVEESIAAPLDFELKILEQDLRGDGWEVIRRNVRVGQSPVEVKELIKSEYNRMAGRLKSLFLFGHVPVPYSGDIMPDMHEQHRGAWPADVYYADVDGNWTDSTVNSTIGERPRNHNRPGDGKFDQGSPPSALELQVGRVDLSRMTCFLNKTPSRTEVDLLRLYLDKNHRFRHGRIPTGQRAILLDRRGLGEPEPLAATGWRTFAPFVGEQTESVVNTEFLPRLSTEHFLWSAVFSGGGPTWSDGVGTSDVFALNSINAVFAFFIGSYYGDWDEESNFLRAPLGAPGSVLGVMYAGQPQWICHSMALGNTIGYAARVTQENGPGGVYPPHGPAAGLVHAALMGDPTLRAHPVSPPVGLKGTVAGNAVRLEWGASPAKNLRGYLVYKRSAGSGGFERLTSEVINSLSFEEGAYSPGAEYMVKAVAITETPSGTYWNSSQGLFFPDPLRTLANATPPSPPANLVVTAAGRNGITIRWVATSLNHAGYKLERKHGAGGFVEVAAIPGDTVEFTDSQLPGSGAFTYRIAAYNSGGMSSFSNEAWASTESSRAEFVKLDWETKGNWIGVYGSEGHHAFGSAPNLPPTISITASNLHEFRFTPNQGDERLMLDPTGQRRLGALWSGFTPYSLDLNITDEKTRQFALYALDHGEGRTIQVDVIDFASRAVLDSRKVEDHTSGVYFVYNIKGRVLMQITPRLQIENTTISGLFFDRVEVHPVELTHGQAGAFFGRQEIGLRSPTPGSLIYYTLDGTEPTTSSRLYQGPFWISEDTLLRARAFLDGLPPSPIFQAEFINVSANQGGALRSDSETRGNWIGNYGSEGHLLAGGSRSAPGYAAVNITGANEWVWNESTDDGRALFANLDETQRRAAAWYSPDAITIDLRLQDAASRTVALYFVDWDRRSREQRVEVIGADGTVIEEVTVSGFAEGQYLALNVQGELRIRITRLQGDNAVLSGIFFDPAAPELSDPDPVRLQQPAISGGEFSLKFATEPGRKVCLDRSTDLRQWQCISTNLTHGALFEMRDNGVQSGSRRYYRVHFVP